MIDYDSLEEFRDPITYDVECDGFTADMPVMEQWARKLGGPLLDIACGTGRMAIHMAQLGFQVTGVDVVPEMIAHAKTKAAAHNVNLEFVVADARAFHLGKKFPFIYMLMNAFQFLHTRQDHEGLFACVREHLEPDGYFLFETRNPCPRNLNLLRHLDPDVFIQPDGSKLTLTEQQYYDPLTQIQHYTRRRHWDYADGTQLDLPHRTALRYVYPQEMESLLHYNGIKIHTLYGDWQQNPLTADSYSMIIVCQKRT